MRVRRVNIQIDGTSVCVAPNTTVLQACESVGVEIPRFCFHERLQVAGNCRMCLVEVFKSPKPQASCALPVMEGMQVFTDSPLVKKAREGVLEIILKNHPLDCPICDQGGECDLQDEAWSFGRPWSRFTETKRSVLDKNLGPLVKTIINRCIHCTRCVRFATEVAGVEVLGTTSRGETTEIGTYIGKVFNSELSGNVIDLCPVGALTSKPYAFTARPWELQSVESIDLSDGLGRNTRLDTRGSDLLRVLPRLNEEINEEWLADKARFRHDGLTQQRLVAPVFKKDGFFHQVSFSEARRKFKNLFQQAILSEQQGSLGLFLGETSDAQTLMAAQGLSDIIPDRFVESRHSHLRGSVKKRIISADLPNNFGFNSSLDALENSDLCILVGVNPRREGTLINTRLRKGVLKGNISVANFGPSMDLTYPVQHLGTSLSSFLNFVEGKHSFSKMLSVAQNPVILLGTGPLYSDEGPFFIQGCQRLSDRFKNLSLNILHSKANEVTALTVGSVSEDTRVKCALGIAIEKDRLPENTASQWVYIGSHIRDEILNHPGLQLCLPASRFAEKSGMFLSLTKSIQETTKAVPSPEEAQSRSLILENLIFLLEDLGYAGLSNLRKTSDHQLNLEDSFCLERRSRNIQDVQTPLVLNQLIPTLDEEEIFFQSNIICRNSPTLSVCAQSKTWSNF